jgi:hypothetical protein
MENHFPVGTTTRQESSREAIEMTIRPVRFGLAFLLLIAGSGQRSSAQEADGAAKVLAQPSDPKLSASVAKHEFRLLEPIVITVELSTTSPAAFPVLVDPQFYRMFRLKVERLDGGRVHRTSYFERIDGVVFGTKEGSIKRGHPLRAELVANLAYDMTVPGDYRITLACVWNGEVGAIAPEDTLPEDHRPRRRGDRSRDSGVEHRSNPSSTPQEGTVQAAPLIVTVKGLPANVQDLAEERNAGK